MGEIGKRLGERGVATGFDTEDAVDGTPDEDGFEDHLIPALLVEVLSRKWIVQSDRIEDVHDVAAQSIPGERYEGLGFREEGQGGEQGDGFTHVGGFQQRAIGREESFRVLLNQG